MNKEKLMENWDTLKDETKTKILALADKEIKEDYFVPKEGEKYYVSVFGLTGGSYYTNYFCGNDTDEYHIEIGNCFKTPKEALFAGNCDYYTKRFETYVERHTEKVDWTDYDQSKYYVFYSLDDMDIEYDYIYSYKQQGTSYASSEQILKDAIADIGEENFLKYVLKVEEKGENINEK